MIRLMSPRKGNDMNKYDSYEIERKAQAKRTETHAAYIRTLSAYENAQRDKLSAYIKSGTR